MLNISHPFLSKLLDEGVTPYVKVGTHRLIHLSKVLAYKRYRDLERSKGMEQLVRMSGELGLYDSDE